MDRRKFIEAATAGTVAIATAVTRANAQRYSVPIIDTHVHLYDPTRPQGVPWPSPEQASIYRTFLPADYRRIAEPFGVVGMIETECSPWLEDNYWVLDVSAKETIVVGEIGDLFPGKPDFGEHLSRLHKNPLYLGTRFAYLWGRDVAEEIQKPQVMADLRLLSDAALTLDSGGGQKDVPNLLRITDQIPTLRIVINHLPGAPIPDEPAARAAYQQGLRELGKRPQVYVKVSEVFQRVDDKGRRVRSGGSISAPSTSPLFTLSMASCRLCTYTGWMASKSGLASFETFTLSPPRLICVADAGTSLRTATRGLSGPLVTAKPTSAAITIG